MYTNPNGHVPVGTGQQLPNAQFRQQQGNQVVVQVPGMYGPNTIHVQRGRVGVPARQIPGTQLGVNLNK